MLKCVIFWLLQYKGSGFRHLSGRPSQLSLPHSVSAGPVPECQKPSEKCSFPQGYTRLFKKKEVTALAAVIFISQLTEANSKEVSGNYFFYFFLKVSLCVTLVVTSTPPTAPIPTILVQVSLIPHSTLKQAEGGRPADATPPAGHGAPATGRAAPVGDRGCRS